MLLLITPEAKVLSGFTKPYLAAAIVLRVGDCHLVGAIIIATNRMLRSITGPFRNISKRI